MSTQDNPEDMLTSDQVAALCKISPGTWRSYVSRQHAPAPDEPDEGRPANRRSPKWRRSTIQAWLDRRRGQTWRSGQKNVHR